LIHHVTVFIICFFKVVVSIL